jgi:hypothetical protein
MKKRIILSLLLLTITVAAFCQVANDQAADVLAQWGVSKPLALTILAIAGVLIGKLVPNKFADIFHYVRILFDWLDEHTNRLSAKQKLAKARMAGKAFKVIIFAVMLSGIGIAASAQSPWHNFWKPVTAENFSMLKGTGQTNEFVFHPTVDISATQTYFVEKQIKTEPLIGAGIGVSYLHYKDILTTPYNDYGINALALFSMTDAGGLTISPALTFSYQSISAGAYYNFADKRLALLTGIVLKF